LAALDIASWDLYAKKNNISLSRFLGSTKKEIPTYGSSGWLSLSEDELIHECEWYISRGVNAFKIRIGHLDDIKRISLIRKTFGEKFLIMVDANRRYSIDEAIEAGRKLKSYNITWFEEPTASNAITDLENIAKQTSTPIATGENFTMNNNCEV
jgi:L-alanine-DL-glutamate epimerase-like enolase superfamily enzyme